MQQMSISEITNPIKKTKQDMDDAIKSLVGAKKYIKDNLSDGVICPCCDRHIKVWKRKITSAMAYGLIVMGKRPVGEWIHVENYLKGIAGLPSSVRGDMSKLRFWGLIEKKHGERTDGSKRNGMYRITDKGHKFLSGEITVPRHVYTLNNKALRFSDEITTIVGSLGDKFNYNELMGVN